MVDEIASLTQDQILSAINTLVRQINAEARNTFTETAKGTDFTLAAEHRGARLVATAAITITVPAAGVLGNGFECQIINDSGGNVVIDGPGATNVTAADGEIASVLESNGKQRVVKGASTVVS